MKTRENVYSDEQGQMYLVKKKRYRNYWTVEGLGGEYVTKQEATAVLEAYAAAEGLTYRGQTDHTCAMRNNTAFPYMTLGLERTKSKMRNLARHGKDMNEIAAISGLTREQMRIRNIMYPELLEAYLIGRCEYNHRRLWEAAYHGEV